MNPRRELDRDELVLGPLDEHHVPREAVERGRDRLDEVAAEREIVELERRLAVLELDPSILRGLVSGEPGVRTDVQRPALGDDGAGSREHLAPDHARMRARIHERGLRCRSGSLRARSGDGRPRARGTRIRARARRRGRGRLGFRRRDRRTVLSAAHEQRGDDGRARRGDERRQEDLRAARD
jgi:hypothetical protein